MNTDLIELREVVRTLAQEVAFILRHMADPDEIRHSDKARMTEISERLDQLSDKLSR